MSKDAAVFAGVLIVRRGRLYVQPQNASWGQRLSRLPFPEGAALYRAVLRFVERTGTTIPMDAKVFTRPYEVLLGKHLLSKVKGHRPKMRPLGEGEQRCFICTSSGDGGVTCHRIPCKQRPDA